DLGLDEGARALLQEERVALRPLDEERLERSQLRSAAQERLQKFLRARGWQRIQPDLRVVHLVGPRVAVLRAIVDEEEDPGVAQPSTTRSRHLWVSGSIQWRVSNTRRSGPPRGCTTSIRPHPSRAG